MVEAKYKAKTYDWLVRDGTFVVLPPVSGNNLNNNNNNDSKNREDYKNNHKSDFPVF